MKGKNMYINFAVNRGCGWEKIRTANAPPAGGQKYLIYQGGVGVVPKKSELLKK